ncbi:MAG: OmpA family protein [Oligoflexia bacterium]|nr:OmpA family protein [Oligoflexia bacterium]
MTFRFKRLSLISGLAGLTAIIALGIGSGCASKKTQAENENAPVIANADENAAGDSDSGKAMGLETVHFPFDSFTLDSKGKSTLKANAEILKAHPSVKIQIEGHCDARGGIQYNIALGEKRANAVKNYLTDMEISGDRVTTISFGKERPVDPGTTEEAYAKNRRANFVITSH